MAKRNRRPIGEPRVSEVVPSEHVIRLDAGFRKAIAERRSGRSARRPSSVVTRSQTPTPRTTAEPPHDELHTPLFVCGQVRALVLRLPCRWRISGLGRRGGSVLLRWVREYQARRRDSPTSRDTRPEARTGTIRGRRHARGLLASAHLCARQLARKAQVTALSSRRQEHSTSSNPASRSAPSSASTGSSDPPRRTTRNARAPPRH
jgi:hypothetical protein